MADDAPATLRLDKFLWFARLARTRSAAQAYAEAGTLRLDGRRIDRAHAPVRVGSVIAFVQGGRVRVIRVAAIPKRRGPAPEAQQCYADVTTLGPVPD
ncbi:RNA-binding S4 domain-containing protein [Sphingomonas sp. GlSt437]|uniref:RNA-binding S4 domain-containing protein n=1 Tax=Sphingomonas sp. GlSt437 TaxID=3389970 RepID=UPI003A869D33